MTTTNLDTLRGRRDSAAYRLDAAYVSRVAHPNSARATNRYMDAYASYQVARYAYEDACDDAGVTPEPAPATAY